MSFFASSGDSGADSGLIYPSASPEVVSVGGTSLYLTEEPLEQRGRLGRQRRRLQPRILDTLLPAEGRLPRQRRHQRTNPDVAADADPDTGVAIYDPYDFGTATPWVQVGGTSVAAPLWAGMAAIADQGRMLAGGQPLGATQMLTDLYDLDNRARATSTTSPRATTATPPDPAMTWSPAWARPRPTS